MAKNKKTKKWIKFRHKVVTAMAGLFLNHRIKRKYRAKIDKFKPDKNKNYLILYNHQTGFDQFFIAKAFPGAVYYVATEDIFSLGFVSKLIRYAVAPIPIRKQMNDIDAVMTCIKVAKEGGTIAIAPEGNRTYSGKTCYFEPAIVKMAKALRLPIAIFRIDGGYGVHPRWADDIRSGGLHAYVKRVIEPEEYLKLPNDELYSLLKTELYVDESVPDKEFHHKNLANYIERAMYYCPDCGLSVFESEGDLITCKKCDKAVRYLPNKQLLGVGFDFRYKNIAEWYEGQEAFMNGLDLDGLLGAPLYEDVATVSEVKLYKRKVVLDKSARISLFANKLTITGDDLDLELNFDDIKVLTVLGKNKINVYHNDKVYQLKGDVRMNALKYVHLYHRYKNIREGKANEFLGI